MIPEPVFSVGDKPEAALQRAVVNAVHSLLQGAAVSHVLIERYGLDVSVFLPYGFRQFELKAYNGTRVGFGDGRGEGPQIDLLWDKDIGECRSAADLEILDKSVRWILMDCVERPHRFTIFTCAQAQRAASGSGVVPRKQNNFRLAAFEAHWVSWPELLNQVRNFLVHQN